VTGTLPFALKREHSSGVYVYMNMETTNSTLVRVSRFFSDRYAYRAQPDYLSELIALGMIVFIAVWPIILVAHAMAVAPR
jgi:Uri superfamily endonuclease